MKRSFVKVARMRIEAVVVGDVVNREPDAETGWFEVAETKALFNGDIQLADQTALITVSGPFFTLVGVQFVSEADVPDQPPSPLSPVVGEDGSDAENPEQDDEPSDPQTKKSAEPQAKKPVETRSNPFADRPASPSPGAQAAKSDRIDDDMGDQSHAEKGALPQLPSRQQTRSAALETLTS